MNTLAEIETYVRDGLTAKGYPSTLYIGVGPSGNQDVQDAAFGPMVVLTPAPGPGLTLEGAYDRVVWSVLSVGDQGDYTGAEKLAKDVDNLLDIPDSSPVDGQYILYSVRAGGRPALTAWDSAERYQFSCSYVIAVQYNQGS